MEDDVLTKERVKALEQARELSVKVLKALDSLEKSEEWNTLKELVFNEALAKIERSLLIEATKIPVDVMKICVLQGERNFAKRYCDIKKFAEFHKTLLEEVNNQLK